MVGVTWSANGSGGPSGSGDHVHRITLYYSTVLT